MLRRPPPHTSSLTEQEAFRVLRSNLLVSIADLANPVVIITSAQPGEGKTHVSVSLARSLAVAGQRVVLVDVDLRHPDAHRRLGAHNEIGVADVLLDRRPVDQCLQYIDLDDAPGSRSGLYFLATGLGVLNPTELLGSQRTVRLLDTLAAQADIVLLDTPPVLPVADPLVIGRMAAGALLVVEARRTPVPSVLKARDALTRNQTRVLGVALNKVPSGETGGGYGYGYYRHGRATTAEASAEAAPVTTG